MLLAGDEIGRTQQGNNNAYCQDNEVSWVDWTLDAERSSLLGFVRRLIQLRREHPAFRRRDFFQGRPLRGGGVKDILWLRPDGAEMSDHEWEREHARCLAVYLAGDGLNEVDRRGRSLRDDDFLMLFNAHHEEIAFVLPALPGEPWRCVLDTACSDGAGCPPGAGNAPDPARTAFAAGASYALKGRSLALLTRPSAPT
jgi:glycogen operon protein